VRQQKENGSKWRMILSGGQCSRTAEKFGASGDAPSSLSACFSGLRFVATDFSRWGKEWEGEAPAEPSCRQVVRSANRQVGKERQRIANGEQRVASSFAWQCSCIAENFGLTTALSTSHSDWAHWKVRPSQTPKEFGAQKNLSNPMSLVPCPLSLTG
jgi:hypothetical protein